MIKRGVSELAVFAIKNQKEEVLFTDIKKLFLLLNRDTVYVTLHGKLYGIICLGDCLRKNDKEQVIINTEYIKICDWNAMQAKEIFLANKKVSNIPVVNAKFELLGEYRRWNERIYANDTIKLKKLLKMSGYLSEQRKLYVVITRDHTYFKELDGMPCVEFISVMQSIDYLDKDALILFQTREQKRAIQCSYGKTKAELLSEAEIWDSYIHWNEKRLERVLKLLEVSGLRVYTFGNFGDNKFYTDYYQEAMEKQKNWKESDVKEWAENFFADAYTEEYSRKILSMKFVHESRKGVRRLKEIKNELLNVSDGKRKTCYWTDS